MVGTGFFLGRAKRFGEFRKERDGFLNFGVGAGLDFVARRQTEDQIDNFRSDPHSQSSLVGKPVLVRRPNALVVKKIFEFPEHRHVWLEAGEFLIVSRGVEHRPVADEEAHVLLFEPATTLNTGDVRDERTVDEPERI